MEFRVVVIFVVGLLGVLSFLTGLAAEFTRIKPSQIEVYETYCLYPESPAKALGLTAAVTLFIGQIILNAASGCICCKKHNRNTIQMRLICVISWIACFISLRLFLAGAALNDGTVNGSDGFSYDGYSYICFYVKKGVFGSGAFLSAVSINLGLFYYITMTKEDVPTFDQTAMPMGQPQFPPYNPNPNPNPVPFPPQV